MRKVRNWMVLLGLAMGLIALFSGVKPHAVEPLDRITGMVVAFAALMPFYVMRWMGAGDVKFAAVIGLWWGISPELLLIWLGGSLLAGLHGLAVTFWRHLQTSPVGVWLQCHLPRNFYTLLEGSAISPAPAVNLADKATIQRSIPYAGYMAVVAIGVLMHASFLR